MEYKTETKYDNILVIVSQAAGVGDVILASPVFRALRANFPRARITLMVNPTTVKIVSNNTYFDEVLIYDTSASVIKKISFIRRLRTLKFDLAFCLSECFSSLLLCYLSAAKIRVGFDWNKRGMFLNVKVPYYKPEKKYLGELFLDLLRAAGLPEETLNPNLEFWHSEEDIKAAGKFLDAQGVTEKDLKVVVHPGAGWSPRRWPAERFAGLIEKVMGKYKAKVFIAGSEEDRVLIEQIIGIVGDISKDSLSIGEDKRLFNCVGCFSLNQFAGLLSLSDLFIGNDSAPMHLAAAVNAPLVALFGPSSAVKYGPRSEHSIIIKSLASCGPCLQLTGQDRCIKGSPDCMNLITVEQVEQAVEQLLT